ncbi:MAG TPA: tetratricopeptide repeat protein [Myxococcota bacterium]|jgi:tetratricopeptide (TPR) repeat protein|nr:tetratricopeptide repeat protein [Myxococcota bacterium]
MASAGRSTRSALVAAGLVAAVLAVYGQTLGFGYAQSDDLMYVVDNEAVRSGLSLRGVAWAFTSGYAANWHPFTWLTLMLDAELFGPVPAAFHATNVALHALAACLLFGALQSATGRLGASAFAAALFAVHPVHAESVAWITERKDVLAAAFGFGALWAYVGYARHGGALRYLGVAALFACGLMSKPTLVSWPFLLLLLDVWPLARWRPRGASGPVPGIAPEVVPAPQRSAGALVREKLPLLVFSLVSCVVTLHVQEAPLQVGESIGPFDRVGNAAVSYTRYLGKLVWPDGFAFFLPHPALPGGTPLTPAGVGLALLLLGVATVVAWRAASRAPWLLVGWLWFAGVLVPMIGLVQVGRQGMADRYALLSFPGLYVALAWTADQGLAGWRTRAAWRRDLWIALALALIVALGARAGLQVRTWGSPHALFAQAIEIAPDSPFGLSGLAAVLVAEGRIPEAEALLRHARERAPDDLGALANMAVVQVARGDLDEAVRLASRVVEIDPSAPHHVQLAKFLQADGRAAEAEAHFRAAAEEDTTNPEARRLLARLLEARGEREEADRLRAEAIALHERALARGFAAARAELRMGEIELERGRAGEAQRHFEAALRLAPDDEAASAGLARAQQALEARGR